MIRLPRSPLALLAVALAAPLVYAALPEASPGPDAPQPCPQAEWVVREAGQCLLHPVQRWERVHDVAGVRLQTCRQHLATLHNLGFYQDEAYRAAEWVQANKAGVAQYWRAVIGREFCTDVTKRALPSSSPVGQLRAEVPPVR